MRILVRVFLLVIILGCCGIQGQGTIVWPVSIFVLSCSYEQ